MKKFFVYSIVLMSMLSLATVSFAQNSMSDEQVLEYVKNGVSQGKSQQTIVQELVVLGVSRTQAARVRDMYVRRKGGDEGADAVESKVAARMIRLPNSEDAEDVDPLLSEGIEKSANDEAALPEAGNAVFGRSVFGSGNLSFATSPNMPTPKNYILGPGDEVVVDIFGANQSSIRGVINPEGYITIDLLGPVPLSGKTIDGANVYLKNKLSAIYGGLNGHDETSDIQVSLGRVRSIQVTILGEVRNPGTFMVSSLSTVFRAMFLARGVKEPGTVRSIKVIRNNKVLTTVDTYDFLINGSRKNDLRLEEGDVILVEPYEKVVKISGFVKRPMNFEMKGKETVSDLIKYAGGFDRLAYSESLSLIRQTNHDYTVYTIDASQYDSFVVENGDEIEVRKLESRFDNRISITGSVLLPGVFELNNEVNSVRKLVNKAGGLQPEAFTQRALIHRQNVDRSLETFAVDLGEIMSGTKADVPLQNNDELVVHSVFELTDQGTLTINGEVAIPGTFPFASNTTVKDLILQAGGLRRSASVVRIDVARMITDSESLVAQKDIATYYTFSMQNGFSVDGADEFVLEPYDVVTVRKSPSYVTGRTIRIVGEVNFPGTYNLSKREERVSDLLLKAGGITDFAYVKGTRLMRQMSEEERIQRQSIKTTLRSEDDSIMVDNSSFYSISFDMEDAIKNPGGENDLVLREGDVVDIPVFNNTVRINGAVQVPTTVTYKPGLTKKKLVIAAGGYVKRAYKHKAFVVYMNGRVSKLKMFTKIEPGCQVYVPIKEKRNVNVQNVLGISTTAASLGMMGVSIANLLK